MAIHDGPPAGTRRRVLRATATAAPGACAGLAALAGCLEGFGGSPEGTMNDFTFETPAFSDGSTIPREYTCDGRDVSPALEFGGLPDGTDTLAVVVDDPDAPGTVFTHWLIWNVPADAGRIPKDVPQTETVSDLGGARQGTNNFDEVGYRGPCPPGEHGAHTYRFTAYAVRGELDVRAGAREDRLTDALDGKTVGRSRFTGEYERV